MTPAGRRTPLPSTATAAMVETAWHYRLDEVSPADLPMTAAHALADGLDTPALCELAGLPRNADTGDVRELYERALRELGIQLPEPATAQRYRLHRLARLILHDTAADPAVLARDDWHEIPAATVEERDLAALLPSCSCCLEYTLPADRGVWTVELRAAASALALAPPIGPGS